MAAAAFTISVATPVYAQTPMVAPGAPTTPPAGAGPTPEMPAPQTVQGLPTLRLSGLSLSGSVDASETYATNVFGLGGTYSRSGDFITTVGLNLDAHDHTVRFDGDLQFRLAADHYASNSSYDRIYAYLTALATAELVPEHLFFRGSAFAAPLLVNNLGPLGAGGRPVATGSNTGIRDTYGYSISPDLKFRLGNFASSDTIVSQSSVFFVEPNAPDVTLPIAGQAPPGESYSYGATERISSGSDFNRLNWFLTGSWNQITGSGLVFTETSGVADMKYAVRPALAITGTFGYQTFTSNQALIRSFGGLVALGGLQIKLGPSFQADASAGWQFNSPSYIADLSYQLGPSTSFIASLTDAVTTPAGRLLGMAGQLGINGQGGFVNTGYQPNPIGAPPTVPGVTGYNPLPIDGLGINNSLVRYRSASGSVVHVLDRTQYRVTGFWTHYQTLTVLPAGIPSEGTSTGVELGIFRTVTPQLTGGLTSSYTVQDAFGGQYSILAASIDLSYSFSQRTQLFYRAAYIHRGSDAALVAVSPVSGNVTDTSVTIGIRRQF
jgi:uncharacterized protein (PEP-CTERM system associated)